MSTTRRHDLTDAEDGHATTLEVATMGPPPATPFLREEDLRRHPFPHVLAPGFLPAPVGDAILEWMESGADWRPTHSEDFYDTYDIDLRKEMLPAHVAFLVAPAFVRRLTASMAAAFSTSLHEFVQVTAHKMIEGYQIRPHTDYSTRKRQTHRLLIQLNRGWSYAQGGILIFLDDREPTERLSAHKFYLPHHRLAIGFEISPRSRHAVNPVVDGKRYTLCYSFFAASDPQPGVTLPDVARPLADPAQGSESGPT